MLARAAYDYVSMVRRIHATQYPKETSGKEQPYAPAALQWVPIAKYIGQKPTDDCTPLKIDLPTFDIPGNKAKFGLDCGAVCQRPTHRRHSALSTSSRA